MGKNLSYIGIIGLVIIAVVLGYKIYEQTTGLKSSPPQQVQNGIDSQTTVNQQTSQQTNQSPSITAEEKAVLSFSAQDATDKEINDHNALINKVAQSRTELIINTGCISTPVVLRINQGTKITVKNLDSVSNTVWVDENHNYNIPADGTTAITADFGKGGGTYGYTCGTPQIIGYFQLIP